MANVKISGLPTETTATDAKLSISGDAGTGIASKITWLNVYNYIKSKLGIGEISGLQAALDLKAPLASPTFTGTVTIPSGSALGTPTTLVGTNITGTASGLTAGNVTTNANLTGAVTSVGNATSLGSFTSAQLAAALTNETGSGSAVFATSPALVTPDIGAATGTSLNLSGVLKFSASSSGLADGDMGYSSIYGQYLRGKTGSTDDWAIFAAIGGYLMHNPTGTNNVAYGSLTGSGNVVVGADNGGVLGKIAIGSGLSLVGGTLSATGGSSGTVTTPGMTAGRLVVANSASDIGTTTALTISGSDLDVVGDVQAATFTGSGASLTNVVNSITGTANQVVASGSTGAVTLSLPQSIGTASTPNFAELKLGTGTADSKLNVFTSGVYGVRFGFSGGTTNFIDGSATTFRSEAGATRLVLDGSATFSVPVIMPTGSTAVTPSANDNSTKVATTAYVDALNAVSGTYTPTISSLTNATSPSVNEFSYQRVGSIVSVSGSLSITVTSSATLTEFAFTLPIASNFSAGTQLHGVGTVAGTNTTIGPWVTGNSSTDLGGVAYTPSTSGGQTIYFQFQYRIL